MYWFNLQSEELNNDIEQAGAELCQAQFKLVLADSFNICCHTGHPFTNTLRPFSIYQKIEVISHLPKNLGHLPFTK